MYIQYTNGIRMSNWFPQSADNFMVFWYPNEYWRRHLDQSSCSESTAAQSLPFALLEKFSVYIQEPWETKDDNEDKILMYPFVFHTVLSWSA